MTSFVKIHHSKLLLCAFIGQLLLSPLADMHPYIGVVLALFLLLLVLLGVSYMGNRREVRLLVLPLAAIWLIARALEAFGNGHHFYSHLAPAAGLALSLAVLWATPSSDSVESASSDCVGRRRGSRISRDSSIMRALQRSFDSAQTVKELLDCTKRGAVHFFAVI